MKNRKKYKYTSLGLRIRTIHANPMTVGKKLTLRETNSFLFVFRSGKWKNRICTSLGL